MDENTLKVVASNLTVAYFQLANSKEIASSDSVSEGKMKAVIRIYEGFVSKLSPPVEGHVSTGSESSPTGGIFEGRKGQKSE